MENLFARPSAVSSPKVSIVTPVRNERAHIGAFLESVLCQEGAVDFEIIVADGMSDDGTREILAQASSRDPRIRIIENPARIVSTGLNAAVRDTRGEVVIRMDAHTEYAPDYVVQCLAARRRSGADNVGGPCRALGRTYWQSAIALSFHSRVSTGGGKSHRVDYEGEVDSVCFGCWSREALIRLGLFDEELVRNQDDELNLRLVRSGGKIWQSVHIRSWYYPRATLWALFVQQLQYGYWKVRVIQKHRLVVSIRHLIPGAFVACLLVLALAAPASFRARSLLVWVLLPYAAAMVSASVITCRARENWKYCVVMPLVFLVYHLGYGWGFLMGVMEFIVLRKGGRVTRGEFTQ